VEEIVRKYCYAVACVEYVKSNAQLIECKEKFV
jgi:hypothetical protein